MLESMSLPERLRSMAAQVARNDLSGATTRRLIELDMLEAANLLDTRPASTPPGEMHSCSYYCERPDCVRRQRDELRDALPAASDDPCVRHACKRVRMEMQARIDALSASGDAVAQRDAYIGVQARALGVAEAKLDRVDKVLREFEGLTGAGYRYMAEHVRAAMNPKESSHA